MPRTPIDREGINYWSMLKGRPRPPLGKGQVGYPWKAKKIAETQQLSAYKTKW